MNPAERTRYHQQKGRCFFCRQPMAAYRDSADRHGGFTIDHLVPQSRGGPNNWGNKVLACQPCNSAKGDRPPTEKEIARFERIKGKRAAMLREIMVRVTAEAAVVPPTP